MWRTRERFGSVHIMSGFSSQFAQQLRVLHMICTVAGVFVLVCDARLLHSVTQSRHRLLRAASVVADESLQRCAMIRDARQRPRIFFPGRHSTGAEEENTA